MCGLVWVVCCVDCVGLCFIYSGFGVVVEFNLNRMFIEMVFVIVIMIVEYIDVIVLFIIVMLMLEEILILYDSFV